MLSLATCKGQKQAIYSPFYILFYKNDEKLLAKNCKL